MQLGNVPRVLARPADIRERGIYSASAGSLFGVRCRAVSGARRTADVGAAAGRLCDGNTVETKPVEDAALVRTTGALKATVNFGGILAFGAPTQVQGLGNHELESTYQQTPSPLPSPR